MKFKLLFILLFLGFSLINVGASAVELYDYGGVEIGTTSQVYVKMDEWTVVGLIQSPSTLQVDTTTFSNILVSHKVRIYKNGVAYGPEHVPDGDLLETTDDLSFVNGDTVEIWMYGNVPGLNCYFREMTIYINNNISTTPTLISPSNLSTQTSSPVTLSVSSTDADSDPITYYFYAGTSPTSMSFIGNNDSVGGSSFNWSISQYDEYYWTAFAGDGYENSSNMSTKQFTAIIPPQETTNLLENGDFESWSAGAAAAPDGWTVYGAGVAITRSTDSEYGTYSAQLTRAAGVSSDLRYTITDNIGNYQGKTLTVGMWCKASVASNGRINFYDGVSNSFSTYHTGGGGWEWIEVTKTVSSSATALYILFRSDADSVLFFDGAILVEGIDPSIVPYPANRSTINATYPPLTYDIAFDWQNTGGPQYKLQVATDTNFNLMVVDTFTTNDYSTQVLSVGDEYFWRVYSYDGISLYSDSSDVYSFNITDDSGLTGSAIEGVIYFNSDGYTAIPGAEVVIWNSTWSDSRVTGSNGYYVFPGLAAGQVYSLQAKADRYLDSSVAIINASTDPITKNFYLLDDLTDQEWWHYVKFTVQTIWGTKYPGVTTTVYEGSSVTPYATGTTGSDGSVTFHLNQNVQYRITFINSTAGISETRTLYPKDSHYYVIISSVLDSWDTYTVPISDAINFTISKSEINATHAYINVSYNDSLAETTDLKVYLNQTSDSDYFNQTNLDTWNGGAISSGSHSFIVSNYVGQSYLIHLVATHTTYGVIDSTYSIGFKGEIANKFPGIPASVWLYGSVFILLFTGGIFVNSNVEKGMLIVCIMFFIFYGLGAFGSLPSNVQYSMLAGGILGFIVSLIANLNKSNRDEGFN